MKNVLITIFYADGLHGGVKYTAEIGNFLHSLGYNVFCVGVLTNETTKDFFAKNNVTLFNVLEFPIDIYIDIVWAHHWPILPYLIRKGLKYNKIINSCISKILPVDKPLFFINAIDMFLTLTDKTKNMFVNEYNIEADRIYVLPNTAPDIFFEYKHNMSRKLNSVAVVSNHAPSELLEAMQILEKSGYETVVYGGKNSIDITPDILSKHDVIVSIGKTVQYAMAMGIPVYNYDHFGGNGYIVPETIDIEESVNFSGRNFFTKKSARQIVNEIVSQYCATLSQTNTIKNIAEQRYKLSVRINNVLDILNNMSPVKHVVENNSNRLYFDYCEFVINFAASHINDLHPLKTKKQESGWQRLYRHLRHFKF